jgi:hypothetical protein
VLQLLALMSHADQLLDVPSVHVWVPPSPQAEQLAIQVVDGPSTLQARVPVIPL